VRDVAFERQGNSLTVYIPSSPLVGQILVRSLVFLAFAIPPGIIVLIIAIDLVHGRSSTFLAGLIIAAPFGWGAVRALRILIHAARRGKVPFVVRVSAAGLEIVAPGKVRDMNVSLRCERIVHLFVRPDGLFFHPRILLHIFCDDGAMHVITLPWPKGRPIMDLEDNLRDVIGMCVKP
jgi:hypothetical protein